MIYDKEPSVPLRWPAMILNSGFRILNSGFSGDGKSGTGTGFRAGQSELVLMNFYFMRIDGHWHVTLRGAVVLYGKLIPYNTQVSERSANECILLHRRHAFVAALCGHYSLTIA